MMYLLHLLFLPSLPSELPSFSECALSNTLRPQLKKAYGEEISKGIYSPVHISSHFNNIFCWVSWTVYSQSMRPLCWVLLILHHWTGMIFAITDM